jgi:hypothetical protein
MGNIFNPEQGASYDNTGALVPPAAQEPALAVDTPDTNPTPSTEPVTPTPTTSNDIDWTTVLSEKTGGKITSWEDLTTKLSTPEPTFSNDESRNIFNYLKEGKVDDVLQVYNEQRRLSAVKDLPDADVIKLAMEYKSPNFTPDEVHDEFASRFMLEKPEAPVEDDYLDEDAYAKAQKEYNKDLVKFTKQEKAVIRAMKSEAAEAREYLASLQKDIVLPDIHPTQDAPAADPSLEEDNRKAWEESRKAYLSSLEKSSAEFKEIPFEVNDEGFTFKGSYHIDDAEKAQLSKDLVEKDVVNDLLLSRYDKDGQYDTKQLMDDLYFLKNKNKIIASAVKQAVAQDRLDALRQSKNIDLTGQRNDFTPSIESEVNKMAKTFFAAG